jgi:hypothetical protein
VAITHGYIQLEDLKKAVGDSSASDDSLYETAIESASRMIDRWCARDGTRHFWVEDAPQPRVFQPFNRYLVRTGFFTTTTGLSIETDEDGDGVFETVWSVTDWVAEPTVRPGGEPFDHITAAGVLRGFPVNGRRPCVRVTALWGWPTIPAPVKQACQMVAVALYKSKDYVGSNVGFTESTTDGGAGNILAMARAVIPKSYMLDSAPEAA